MFRPSCSGWRAARQAHREDRALAQLLHCLAASMGRRALLRLDRTQSQARKGLRGHDRLCQSVPLRRIHHAPFTPYREGSVSFETDSESQPKRPLYCSFVDGVLQDLRLGVKIWCDVDVNNRADDVEEGAVVTMPGAP